MVPHVLANVRVERMKILLLFLLLSSIFVTPTSSDTTILASQTSVHVLYYAASNWVDDVVNGNQYCPTVAKCEWTQTPHIQQLKEKFHHGLSTTSNSSMEENHHVVTVAVFHVHSLKEKLNSRYPLNCDWRTNLTMGCSEESGIRYGHLYNSTFPNFDGYSTYHPLASVQRIQKTAFFKEDELRPNPHNFSYLIKAGSYVAKDCHTKGGDKANSNRDGVVFALRQAGFRIDGLSKCMKSQTPEGVYLPKTHDNVQNLLLKREAIARFMFNMAFENSIEDGYVTEKPFDALMAGTVPIYLGDAVHLKRLLPHPKAAIFIADYNGDMKALANYLNFLTRNETAYEEHRAWRKTFSYTDNIKDKPMLQQSWYCQVCQWAVSTLSKRQAMQKNSSVPSTFPQGRLSSSSLALTSSLPESMSTVHAHNITRRRRAKNTTMTTLSSSSSQPDHCVSLDKLRHVCTNLAFFNGKPIKSTGSPDLFLIINQTIRSIPNADTFASLKLDYNVLITAPDNEFAKCPRGLPIPPCTSC